MEVLADAPNQSNNPYCPLQEFPVDEAVLQAVGEGVGVEDLATGADFVAVAVADLEGAVAALGNEVAVLGTGAVSGVEVEVASGVDVTMATGWFKHST